MTITTLRVALQNYPGEPAVAEPAREARARPGRAARHRGEEREARAVPGDAAPRRERRPAGGAAGEALHLPRPVPLPGLRLQNRHPHCYVVSTGAFRTIILIAMW